MKKQSLTHWGLCFFFSCCTEPALNRESQTEVQTELWLVCTVTPLTYISCMYDGYTSYGDVYAHRRQRFNSTYNNINVWVVLCAFGLYMALDDTVVRNPPVKMSLFPKRFECLHLIVMLLVDTKVLSIKFYHKNKAAKHAKHCGIQESMLHSKVAFRVCIGLFWCLVFW